MAVHDDCGKCHAGGECACVFIGANGDASPPFESGKNPVDDVADAIPVRIERRSSSTTRSLGFTPGGLVVLLGRGMSDPAATQHCPGGGIGVALSVAMCSFYLE